MIPNLHQVIKTMFDMAEKEQKNLFLQLGEFNRDSVVVKVLDVGEDYIRGLDQDKKEEFFGTASIKRMRDVSDSEAHIKNFK